MMSPVTSTPLPNKPTVFSFALSLTNFIVSLLTTFVCQPHGRTVVFVNVRELQTQRARTGVIQARIFTFLTVNLVEHQPYTHFGPESQASLEPALPGRMRYLF